MIKQIKYSILLISVLLFSNCGKTTKENNVGDKKSSSKVIILAVDGGGIKGLIPAMILQKIEDTLNLQSFQMFDVIGGTSTGGIISVALTSIDRSDGNNLPFTGSDLVDIYKSEGSNIFVKQNCEVEFCATYYADSGNKVGIEPYLQSLLGTNTTLTSNYRAVTALSRARVKQMFTTSYIVNSNNSSPVSDPVEGIDYGPYLFNWYDAKNDPNQNYYSWETARGSSAAPVYFPIAHVGGGGGPRSNASNKWVVDGGVMSNDPGVWGVTEALRTGIAQSLDDIIVISLGTGLYPGSAGVGINNNASHLIPNDGNWSEGAWMVDELYDLEGNLDGRGSLMNIVLNSVQLVSDNQLRAMQKAGLQYYRLEPDLTLAQDQMDNITPGNIHSLMSTTFQYLASPNGSAKFDSIISVLRTNIPTE